MLYFLHVKNKLVFGGLLSSYISDRRKIFFKDKDNKKWIVNIDNSTIVLLILINFIMFCLSVMKLFVLTVNINEQMKSEVNISTIKYIGITIMFFIEILPIIFLIVKVFTEKYFGLLSIAKIEMMFCNMILVVDVLLLSFGFGIESILCSSFLMICISVFLFLSRNIESIELMKIYDCCSLIDIDIDFHRQQVFDLKKENIRTQRFARIPIVDFYGVQRGDFRTLNGINDTKSLSLMFRIFEENMSSNEIMRSIRHRYTHMTDRNESIGLREIISSRFLRYLCSMSLESDDRGYMSFNNSFVLVPSSPQSKENNYSIIQSRSFENYYHEIIFKMCVFTLFNFHYRSFNLREKIMDIIDFEQYDLDRIYLLDTLYENKFMIVIELIRIIFNDEGEHINIITINDYVPKLVDHILEYCVYNYQYERTSNSKGEPKHDGFCDLVIAKMTKKLSSEKEFQICRETLLSVFKVNFHRKKAKIL